MAIVSSQIIFKSEQADGVYVIEEFTSDIGKVYRVEGLRGKDDDFEKAMADRIEKVEAMIAEETITKEEYIAIDSAVSKIDTYMKGIDLEKDVGLTPEEVSAYLKRGV